MANQIFGTSLNRNVDAKIQCFEQHPGSPGVINYDDRIRRDASDGGNNSRDIMYFHGDRAGRFQKYDFSVRLYVLHNIGTNQRIEPSGGHAEFAENFGAEILAGFIGGVGHQHMIPLFHKGEDSVGNGRRAAGEQRATRAAFQFTHCLLQGKMRQGSATSIEKRTVSTVVRSLLFGLYGVKH